MDTIISPSPAVEAYAELAPYYDLFTAHHQHDLWLGRLEELAIAHGLAGRRVLDVACGTGKSLMPLVRRGYRVTACDVSPEMLAIARATSPPEVELLEADMRSLPLELGPFDMVTCLDDAVNYLLDDDDLADALRAVRGVLAPDGLVVFDVNTRATYRSLYTSAQVVEGDGVFLCWHGHGLDERGDALRASATVEIFERRGGGTWERRRSVHRQRHWRADEILEALEDADLECVAVRGQRIGAVIERHVDEDVHTKALYVARAA